MTLLQSGDHVVVTDNTYGGTYRLFERVLRKYQLDFSYVDTSNLDEIERRFRPTTKMLFLETPTNPMLRLTDLRGACEIAHARNVVVVVDNTFASPYVQRPIEFGADIVVHSTTKFLNGHSDSVGGVVVAVQDEHIEWLRFDPERRGRDPRADGRVAGAARHQDAADPNGAAQRERAGAGRVPRRASEGARRCTTPACRRTRSTRWRKRQMRGFGGLISFELGSLEKRAHAARTACG